MTGERITSYMMQHLNEKVTIDTISRESGVSIQDIQMFLTLREIMDAFKTDISFFEEDGTTYCILQDDRHSITKFYGISDAPQNSSAMFSKAQALKLDRVSAGMLKVDTIFSAITAAIFAIVCAIHVYLVITNLIFYLTTSIPLFLSTFISNSTDLLISILAFSIMWQIDARSSRSALKKGLKSHYGIDVTIAGIIGCFAWGVGTLCIIKAAILFSCEAYKDNLMKRGAIAALMPVTDGFNMSSRLFPIFAGAAGLITSVSWLLDSIIVSGVLGLGMLNQLIATIVLSMIGIIVGYLYRQHVYHAIKRGEFKTIASLLLGLSIAGLACYGTSVPMLIQTILIFGMVEISRKARIGGVKAAHVTKPANISGNVVQNRHEESMANASVPMPALEQKKLSLDFNHDSENHLHESTGSKTDDSKRDIELKLLSWREDEP